MEENNVFTAKTVDEAIEEGLEALGITIDEAEITVIEEGKKKLFGSVKAQVKLTHKRSDGVRAAEFVNGLLEILNVKGIAEILSDEDDETIKLNIKTEQSAKVIGKRGDVLDAIQNLAGAIANIGRDEYKKLILDCENYRTQREETLKALATKLAKTAVETGRKMILEPMASYERRIIHAALMDNAEVKTLSEGREPARYIVVIPNNANPNDRGVRYGERRPNGRRFERGGRPERGGRGERRDRDRGDRRRDGRRSDRPAQSGGAKRGKKEIHFGTFLGNSGAGKNEENKEEQ